MDDLLVWGNAGHGRKWDDAGNALEQRFGRTSLEQPLDECIEFSSRDAWSDCLANGLMGFGDESAGIGHRLNFRRRLQKNHLEVSGERPSPQNRLRAFFEQIARLRLVLL